MENIKRYMFEMKNMVSKIKNIVSIVLPFPECHIVGVM